MIYFIQEKGLFRNRVKIGYTDNIRQRLGQIQSQSPSKLKLILALPGDEQDEFVQHKKFAAYRLHGEWFKFGLRLKAFVWLNQFTVFNQSLPVTDKPLPELTNEAKIPPDPDQSPPSPTPREQAIIDMWEDGAGFNKISQAFYGGRIGGYYNDMIRSTLAKFSKLPKYDPDRAEQIKQMYLENKTKTDIAQHFGYKSNAGAIYYEIKEALNGNDFNPNEKSRIIELFKGGDNLTSICTQIHGYKNQKRIEAIKTVLRENGLIG